MSDARTARGGTAKIWFAAGSVDVNAAKPIWPVGFHDVDQEKLTKEQRATELERRITTWKAFNSGVEVKGEDLDISYSLIPGRKTPAGPQPLMNFGGSLLIVTDAVRALLEELDPGPLRFDAIEVLNAERTAPLWEGAALHSMQVLTCYRAVVIEESYGIGKPNGTLPDGAAQRMVFSTDRHDALIVLPPPDGSAEIWLDDRLMGAVFMTDRIAKALKAAKLTRGWALKRCVLKTVH